MGWFTTTREDILRWAQEKKTRRLLRALSIRSWELKLVAVECLAEVLAGQFWADLDAGLPQARYLGMERIEF